MNADSLVLGLLWYAVFLFSTTCHEAAHALAAKLGGDLTAFHSGQVTIDPLPHIRREPFGMVIMPILSFVLGGWMMGWASAPYDPHWASRHPHRAAWMSLAGPGANLTLVFVAALGIHAGLWLKVFHLPDSANFTRVIAANGAGVPDAFATLLSVLFSLNLLLFSFNLLPIPPLDGFSVAGLLMSEDRARRLEAFGHSNRMFALAGLMLGWRLFGVLYNPIFTFGLRLLYPWTTYG